MSENLHSVLIHELKNLGIKVPKAKKSSTKQDMIVRGNVFGQPLSNLPSSPVIDVHGQLMKIPKFLVDAVDLLRRNLHVEGLFRKTGSISRQKEIKRKLDGGGNLSVNSEAVDVACLVKQFLREMPEPLLVKRLHDVFVKIEELKDSSLQLDALLTACLLLPDDHLDVLRYLMLFFEELALNSHVNKMDATNLAVVLTPNILVSNESMVLRDRRSGADLLRKQTGVVRLLVLNATQIGFAPDNLIKRISCQIEMLAAASTSPFEDAGCAEVVTHLKRRAEKKRNSMHGVLSGLRRMVHHPVRSSVDLTPTTVSKRKHDDDDGGESPQHSSAKKRAVTQLVSGDARPVAIPQPRFDSPDPVSTKGEVIVSHTPEFVCEQPESQKRKSGRMRIFSRGYLRRRNSSVRTPTLDKLSLSGIAANFMSSSNKTGKNCAATVIKKDENCRRKIELGVTPVQYNQLPVLVAIENSATVVDLDNDCSSNLVSSTADSTVDSRKKENKLLAEVASSVRRTSSDSEDSLVATSRRSNFSRQLHRSTLRRGRPNTVSSGLPAPSKSDSPDQVANSPTMTSAVTKQLRMTRNWSTPQMTSATSKCKGDDLAIALGRKSSLRSDRASAAESKAESPASASEADPEVFQTPDVAQLGEFRVPVCGPLRSSSRNRRRSISMSDVVVAAKSGSGVPIVAVGRPEAPEDVRWRSATSVLSQPNVSDTEVANTGRPSLVRLQRDNAGMVSANVKHYNDMVTRRSVKCDQIVISSSNSSSASPVRIPPIFVRTPPAVAPAALKGRRSSGTGSGGQQQQQSRGHGTSSTTSIDVPKKLPTIRSTAKMTTEVRTSPRLTARQSKALRPHVPTRCALRAKAASDAHRRKRTARVTRRSTIL